MAEDILQSYDVHVSVYMSETHEDWRFLDVIRSIQNFWLAVVKYPEE